jgi:hypothetical protein
MCFPSASIVSADAINASKQWCESSSYISSIFSSTPPNLLVQLLAILVADHFSSKFANWATRRRSFALSFGGRPHPTLLAFPFLV